MTFDDDFLAKLICPRTRQALHPLSAEELAEWNRAIAEGNVHTRGGETVEDSLQAALGPASGSHCYRADNDIPILLIDEALERR